MGAGTAELLAAVRASRGEHPADVQPLVELVRSGFPGRIGNLGQLYSVDSCGRVRRVKGGFGMSRAG